MYITIFCRKSVKDINLNSLRKSIESDINGMADYYGITDEKIINRAINHLNIIDEWQETQKCIIQYGTAKQSQLELMRLNKTEKMEGIKKTNFSNQIKQRQSKLQMNKLTTNQTIEEKINIHLSYTTDIIKIKIKTAQMENIGEVIADLISRWFVQIGDCIVCD